MNEQSPERDEAGRSAQKTSSIEQRRRLLRAVGAGGALAGAGLPFSAHATSRPHCTKSSRNYQATASAVGSMIGSDTGNTPPVVGHTCSHYKSSSNWPSGCKSGGNPSRDLTYDNCANPNTAYDPYTHKKIVKLRFCDVFDLSDSRGNLGRECQDLIRNDPTSDEACWLTAMFNANKCNPFTYQPAHVIALYKGCNPLTGGNTQSGIKTKALTLFRDYLSSQS